MSARSARKNSSEKRWSPNEGRPARYLCNATSCIDLRCTGAQRHLTETVRQADAMELEMGGIGSAVLDASGLVDRRVVLRRLKAYVQTNTAPND